MGASLNTAIFRGWPFLATSQEPETRGLGDGGRPRRATELAAYVRDVAVHCMRAQHELTQARIWRSRSDSRAGSSSPASVGRDCCCVSAWRHARTTESTSPCHGKCELPWSSGTTRTDKPTPSLAETSAGADNVTGLVYLAAFGLDAGESCASVQQPFPPSLLSSTSYPTSYDAPGVPQGPDLYISKERFRETFCADVPVDLAEVMFATGRLLSVAALTEAATAAGWKSKPSWYLVSEHDNAIAPDAERFMADRMGATTKSIGGSHTAFISQPVTVAGFITEALTAT